MDLERLIVFLVASSTFLFFLVRVGESFQSRKNYYFLKFANAEECIPNMMKLYYGLEYVFVFFCIIESLVIRGFRFEVLYIGIGTTLMLVGLGLRFWSITTLGRIWSRHCMVIPGVEVVKEGPFKFLSHPEYLSRFLDFGGLCIIFRSFFSLGVYVIVVGFLLVKIIKVESLQLKRLAVEDNKEVL